MPLPTFAEAKLPEVTLPLTVTTSEPRTPAAIGVPEIVAARPVSYCLFAAVRPLIVTGAAVMFAVNALVTPVIW